ncbi:MAG: hypothetical protein H7Y04_09180 [Verrucomicrobia bacterium]|nr:hypothetical protein [Cytophagales bacterium]
MNKTLRTIGLIIIVVFALVLLAWIGKFFLRIVFGLIAILAVWFLIKSFLPEKPIKNPPPENNNF